MDNAIIIRQLDIIKTYIDFNDFDNISNAIHANHLSTVHTVKTQELSSLLGVHLMGFVDRDGDDINNKKACEISGYDYLGSLMLLCKTDDKFNPLPLSEGEVECVFHYLVTGEIVQKHDSEIYKKFCEKYGVNPILPEFPIEPEFFKEDMVPYVIIARYNFDEASENMFQRIGESLFHYSSLLLNSFKEVDEVYLSQDSKYYIKCYKDSNGISKGFYYVMIQAKGAEGIDDIFIKNPKAIVDVMFNKDEKRESFKDDALEEVASSPGDYDYDDEDYEERIYYPGDETDEEEAIKYVFEIELSLRAKDDSKNRELNGKFALPLSEILIDEEHKKQYLPFLGRVFELKSYKLDSSSANIYLNVEGQSRKQYELNLNETLKLLVHTQNEKSETIDGKMNITYKKYDFGDYKGKEKIIIEEQIIDLKNRKIEASFKGNIKAGFTLENTDMKDIGTAIYESDLINETKDVLVISALDVNESKDDRIYYLVKAKEPVVNEWTYLSDKGVPHSRIIKIYLKKGQDKWLTKRKN